MHTPYSVAVSMKAHVKSGGKIPASAYNVMFVRILTYGGESESSDRLNLLTTLHELGSEFNPDALTFDDIHNKLKRVDGLGSAFFDIMSREELPSHLTSAITRLGVKLAEDKRPEFAILALQNALLWGHDSVIKALLPLYHALKGMEETLDVNVDLTLTSSIMCKRGVTVANPESGDILPFREVEYPFVAEQRIAGLTKLKTLEKSASASASGVGSKRARPSE
jgi:hypothetical protein